MKVIKYKREANNKFLHEKFNTRALTLLSFIGKQVIPSDKSNFITKVTWSSIHAEIFNRSIDADSTPFWQLIKCAIALQGKQRQPKPQFIWTELVKILNTINSFKVINQQLDIDINNHTVRFWSLISWMFIHYIYLLTAVVN